MSSTLAAVLSLLSAVVVAVLSHLFAATRKRRDELSEFRLKAYTDFINAASKLVAARRMGRVADEHEELAALNDAKTRICVCAPPVVVEALAEFWNHGGTLEREGEILAFARLCKRIRESLGNPRHDVHSIDLPAVLFKLQPSKYSFKKQGERHEHSREQRDAHGEKEDG
jgi:hypothetical protein